MLSLFALMIPLPANNALYKSIVQSKVPPDLQERIFAMAEQLFLLGSTASFLITGPLVDRILAPRLGPEAAIRLVEVATGIILLAGAGVTFRLRFIRHLETDIPDCEGDTDG